MSQLTEARTDLAKVARILNAALLIEFFSSDLAFLHEGPEGFLHVVVQEFICYARLLEEDHVIVFT